MFKMVVPWKIVDLANDFTENKHEYTNPEIFDEENKRLEELE